MSKLVRLIAPENCCGYRIGGKELDLGPDREVDVPESMVADLLAEGFKRATAREVVLMQGPQGIPGESIQGPTGPRGQEGKRGPIGPMPRHQWDGTELRFEIEPGKWGAWVDLQGPKGEPGRDGSGGGFTGLGAGPLDLSALTVSTNSYFPAGW